MGMTYNKEIKKSDGRTLRASGPRDIQRRQQLDTQHELLIESLNAKINDLSNKLADKSSVPVDGYFTPEQVDEEINKATINYFNEFEITKHSLNSKIKDLELEITKLEERLLLKEELINTLNNTITNLSTSGGIVVDTVGNDRPKLDDDIFIDPLESDSGSDLKSSIKTESVVSDDNVNAKLDKLRKLMGNK